MAPTPTASASASAAPEPVSAPEPASAELPVPVVTSPTVAIHNLEVQIHGEERHLTEAPLDPQSRALLVGFLIKHGEFTGRIADYEHAEKVGEEAVELEPKEARSYRLRARVRSLFHRFDEALADLAKAESLGVAPADLAAPRASIKAARGDLDGALALTDKDVAPTDGPGLANLGLFYLEVGREAEGTELLARARKLVRDVAPFPIASLDYHEAEIRERHGQDNLARQHYQRAFRLLPTYAVAASHLATYLGPEEGVGILEEVAKTSDDPEVQATLSTLLRKVGRNDEANRDVKLAAARYDELTAGHEAAFADHAARFWLGPGNDPERAYVFAQKNLALRQTSAAFDLALTSALLTKRSREACEIATRGLALKYADEAFRAVAKSTALSRCGDATSTRP